MKNNIVRFSRQITFLFCLGKIKCWVRSLGYGHSLVCFAWDDTKLVSCIDAWGQGDAREYAELLVSEALREEPLSIPDVFDDIEFFDDPDIRVTTSTDKSVWHPELGSEPLCNHYQSEEADRDEVIIVYALNLSKAYPGKSFEEWLQLLRETGT